MACLGPKVVLPSLGLRPSTHKILLLTIFDRRALFPFSRQGV
jgi:hypothetical protein